MRNERILLKGGSIYERGLAMASPQTSKKRMKMFADKLEGLLKHLFKTSKKLAQKGTRLIMFHFDVVMAKHEKRGKERKGWLPKAMPEKMMEAVSQWASGGGEELRGRIKYGKDPRLRSVTMVAI